MEDVEISLVRWDLSSSFGVPGYTGGASCIDACHDIFRSHYKIYNINDIIAFISCHIHSSKLVH